MRRKILLLSIVGGVLVILIAFFLFFGLKVRFLISEELRVDLTPSSIHLDTQRETQEAQVELTTHTFFQCTARCSYEIHDLSTNRTLKQDTLIFDEASSAVIPFTLEPPLQGEGVKYISFDVQCQNIRSTLCFTQEDPLHKTSLITLNYTYTQDEQVAKEFLEQTLPNLSSQISQAEAKLDAAMMLAQRTVQLAESKEVIRQEQTLDVQASALRTHFESLILSYNSLRFFDAAQRLSVQNQKDVKALEAKSTVLLNQSESILDEYNSLQEVLSTFPLIRLKEIAVFYNEYAFEEDYAQIMHLINNEFLPLKEAFTTQSSLEGLNIRIDDLFSASSEAIVEQDTIILEAEELFGVNYSCSNFARVIAQNSSAAEDNETANNESNTTTILTPREVYFEAHCSGSLNETPQFPTMYTPQRVNNSYAITPESLTPLKEHLPQCCINENCSACGVDPKTPILFIHGHAFNEENTPEFSMNAFAQIQKKLESEGIVNAGELDSAQNVPEGIFGLHNHPVSIRSTFYYITTYDVGRYEVQTQKSERIENYAIRLAEIIRDVKERTGSEQVIIVAHSMGGLVAREYMVLFGEEDVKKLITINTPHKGVKGTVKKYCTILGSLRECEDMSEGSVFLNRLNARSTPDNIVVIRATGCKMGDERGDGIVTQENSYLEGAQDYLFEGGCTDSLQTDLHQRLLDPDEFPQVYELLVEKITS